MAGSTTTAPTKMIFSDSGALAACQFHPEKSSLAGAQLLQRWLAWVQEA